MNKPNYLEEAEGWIIAYKSRLHDEKEYRADAAYKLAQLHIAMAQVEATREQTAAIEAQTAAITKAIYSNNQYN